MSDVYIEQTITGASFSNGATLSGHYTVEYDSTGTLIGVSDVDLVVTSVDGTSDFTSLTPFATDTTSGTHYELRGASANGPYSSIDLTFRDENPTHLSVNDYNGLFSSLQEETGTGGTQTYNLANGGVINSETVCFFAGTAIKTPQGEVAIETLKAGDLVLTSDGSVAPIRWLGRQTVSTRFADPLRVLPIRIRAGALGDNLPVRDLLTSPDHALLVDGVLAQASTLVNGVSITRETAVPEVFTYYHVELCDHSLILAEGVAAETFVDNVTRMGFDNWDEHEALEDGDAPIAEMAYPRASAARHVPAATHERLMALAVAGNEAAIAA